MKGTKKYADALDLAADEDFDWDYKGASPDELYVALYELGYDWDDERNCWIDPDGNKI